MRLVLDTNVVASAMLWGGSPKLLLQARREKRVELYTSTPLLAELADILGRRKFEKKIAASVKPIGWSLTNRYSPGYCDWPVSDQHNLFSLLPAGFCGITLTSSALMVPVKSLSGVIGVGSGVKRGAYQCSICDLKDCYRRREEPEELEEQR